MRKLLAVINSVITGANVSDTDSVSSISIPKIKKMRKNMKTDFVKKFKIFLRRIEKVQSIYKIIVYVSCCL